MKKMEFDLIFCIFGCDTIPKYRDEILKIEETWGKDVKGSSTPEGVAPVGAIPKACNRCR